MTTFTSSRGLAPWQAGLALRREWPDRTHEFIGFSLSTDKLARLIERDVAYWRRGPIRPTYSVVLISLREFAWHRRRRDCRSLDCPTTSEEAPTSAAPLASGSG